VRTLFKIVKELRQSSLWTPHTSWLALSSSHCSSVLATTSQLLGELQILVKNGMNHFSWHIMCLSEFPNIFSPFILCFLWSAATRFPPLPIDNRFYLCSL
jgi:hypothetical protein